MTVMPFTASPRDDDAQSAAETSRELIPRARSGLQPRSRSGHRAVETRDRVDSPDDPAPHRSLASVLWLNLLFRRGAVTADHYLGSFSRSTVDLPKPAPELERRVPRSRQSRDRTCRKTRRRQSEGSHKPTTILAPQSGWKPCYVATVEGKILAGFRAARRCYDEHEKVLDIDPSRKDAGLVVGTYRYVVSTLSLPVRMLAYVAGFGGGRDRGIQMLRETAESDLDTRARAAPRDARAESGNDVRADALFALVLVYNREHRYDEALQALERLRRLFPRNRLIWLESGSTALRAGRGQQADELLTQGLAALAKDQRLRMPGEDALWHYKRGAARALLGRSEDATADLQFALGADPQAWVNGRARVELGRLALKRGDRSSAATEAKQAEALCERGNDSVCVQDARSVLRSSNGR